ncbi:hypothetical protein ACQ4M3_09490 [Leptolyngbya sp. AN03gr2]|uniref:hypothetical protein n=1 Tax=Leptolyngbya sp. AN03gr2 TaxID=3423364 RepID=UPI003D31CDCF
MATLSETMMIWFKKQLGLPDLKRQLDSIDQTLEIGFGRVFETLNILKGDLEMLREEFKSALAPIAEHLKKGLEAEAKNAALLVTVAELETKLAAATGDIEAFKAENALELAALAELVASPKTPVADEIVKGVEESEQIETPEVVVEEMPAVEDPATPTPIEVSEEAVDAIVDAL